MIAVPLMQRVSKPRRPFVWLALLLISASGLFAGVALRSLVPHAAGIATTTGITSTGSSTTTTSATNPVVTIPRRFTAFVCPANVTRGTSLTLTAYATSWDIQGKVECSAATVKLPFSAILAAGVACKLTFPANSGITAPMQTTDATGTTTWQIAIPATTPPGADAVSLHATWGKDYSANWQMTVTMK